MTTQVVVGSARLRLVQGDITRERVDAIVNAANPPKSTIFLSSFVSEPKDAL